MAPLSPVPVKVGSVTLVMSSVDDRPLSFTNVTPAGGRATVSSVTISGGDAAELFPATSTWVAVMLFAPLTSAVVAVIDQPPFVTSPVPSTVLPSRKVTVAPFSPVPVKVGSVTLVMSSVGESPLSLTNVSAAGGRASVSSVTTSGVDAVEVFPATSTWVAVMLFAPPTSAVVAVIDQPPSVTRPVPSTVLPSNSVTVAPFSPVPVKFDSATFVMSSVCDNPLSLTNVTPVGASGAIVSIVNTPAGFPTTEVRSFGLPAWSVTDAPLRLIALIARSGVFCAEATV